MLLVIVVGLCIWRCCCRRRRGGGGSVGGARGRGAGKSVLPLGPIKPDSSYRPLHDPAPPPVLPPPYSSTTNLNYAGGSSGGYNDPYHHSGPSR